MPHAVVRLYTDSGPLIGVLREREGEVRDIMTSVPGFISYGIMDTGTGAISVTTCQDKAGTDESIRRAAKWINENLPDAKIDPPQIFEGDNVIRFDAQDLPTTIRGSAHLSVRIFDAPPPAGLIERMDEARAVMRAVPGFRAYTAIANQTGGVSITAAADKAACDAVGNAMRDFIRTNFPTRQGPQQVIEADGVFRFDAQPTPA
jgi:hypothetical protein